MTDNEIALEICRRLNIPTKGKVTGNVVVKCFNPHHIDNNPSCSLSLDKGIYHCFSCGNSGSLRSLYYEKFRVDIYKDLGVQRNLSLFQVTQEETADFSVPPDIDFAFTGKSYPMDSTELSKRWMKSRGFDIKLLNKLSIKYLKNGKVVKASEPDNRSEWHIYTEMAIIPIYEQNKLLCFEARQLRTEEEWKKHLEDKKIPLEGKSYKKVLYPKNSSTKTLYRLEHLDRDKPLYLVEGLMDNISLKTHPLFENSTTTFGRGIKERQFYLLGRFKKIVYIPNNDGPGISAIDQFKKKNMKNVHILLLPKTVKDVNDILQKKDPRYSTLEDLVIKDWHKNEIHIDNFNVEKSINSLLI